MSLTIYNLTIAVILVGILTFAFFIDKKVTPEPQLTATSTFTQSWNCEFYKKVKGEDMVIEEPKGGSYKYEVYATAEGIEVWRCNNI